MLTLARLIPLLGVTLAAAAEVPAPPPLQAAPTSVPTPSAPPAPTPPPTPLNNEDIQAVFAGKAACPPGEAPVGVGPWEFHADGDYMRQQDLASAHGRYAVANGKICVTLVDSDKVDFCLAVLKRGDGYLFRLDESESVASRRDPVAVTPCPLPSH